MAENLFALINTYTTVPKNPYIENVCIFFATLVSWDKGV
jgi:hypothetical protein